MICNPQRSEIKNNFDGCLIKFRSDLFAKTCNMNVNEILKDLIQNKIFENIIVYTGVIEFKERTSIFAFTSNVK